jgi:hypoxia up-regulated 1
LKEASVSVELPTPPEDVKEEDEEKKEEVVAEGEAASTEAEASTESAADSESSTETEGSEEKKKEVKKDKKTRDKKKDSKRKEVKKDNTLRAVLVITPNRQVLSPAHWSVAQIEDSKAKLKVLQDVDDERKGKEAAMNELEGFIYKVKNRLMDDEEVLKAVSTEEQRQEVVDMANEAEEWLYDGGRDASSDGYKAKQEELNVKFAAIIKRYTEVGARDEKIKAYRKYLGDVKNAVSGWAEKKAHITDEEKNELLEKVTTAEKWLEGKLEAQASKTAFEEAAFEAAEVPKQLKVLALQFDKVSKKPKPAPVVVEKNETEADAATNETESETVRVEVESEATEEDVKVEEEVKVEESSDSTETDGEL